MNRDTLRLVDIENIIDGLEQIGLAAKYRGALGK
jgi:hypothetical protein